MKTSTSSATFTSTHSMFSYLCIIIATLFFSTCVPQVSAWGNTSLLVVRVGDGTTCPSTNTLCNRATQVYLDEINYITGAVLSTNTISGVTLGSTDQYVGTLSRCADGTCVTFGAQDAATGTAPTTVSPWFASNRVIVRVKADNTVDASTKILQADYNGLIKGVCSSDGTGYWVVGNATTSCVTYVAHGTTSTNAVTVAAGPQCTTTQGAMNGRYTGCVVTTNPSNIYFARTYASYGFVDITYTPQSSWSSASSLWIEGTNTSKISQGFAAPWYYSGIFTNVAQDTWWLVEPRMCGIAICKTRDAIPLLPTAPNLASPGCSWLYGGGGTGICPVSGASLTPDEKFIFFTSRSGIYRIPSRTTGSVIAIATAAAFNEYRGISFPPYTCGSGSTGTPIEGYYCTAGAGSALLPCMPGSYAPLGTTSSCPLCPAGYFTNSVATRVCTPCSAGISCIAGSTSDTIPCPAGSFCAGNGAGPVACSAGFFCPGSSTTNTVACPPGFYCPGGGSPPVPCPVGTASNTTGASTNVCSNCLAGTYNDLTGQAFCSKCPISTYNPSTGSVSASDCAFCSDGIWCLEGSSINTVQCPAGWFCGGVRGTGPCPSGRFSSAVGAIQNTTCANCPAGIWCPEASYNTTVSCLPGWQCPGNGAPNSLCRPGFFSANYGASTCTLCAAGSLANVFGATSCTICPAGSYVESGSASLTCSLCPPNTFSPNPGAGSRAFCAPCPSGYSSQAGATSCQAMSWTRMKPLFPLTGRSGGVSISNSSAFLAIGGRKADSMLSGISMAYDSYTGEMVESGADTLGLPNMTFDRAAVALHPTDGSSWVFGGMSASGTESSNLWRLTTETSSLPAVSQIFPSGGPTPPTRKSAGLAYMTPCPAMSNGCLVLFGGDRNGVLLGDLWVFDVTARTWVNIISANAPSARSGHVMTTSPNSSILYVFGGTTSSGATNDLFALNPFGFWDALPSEMTNIALNKLATISGNDASLSTRGAAAAVDGAVTTRHTPTVGGVPATCLCNWCAMTPTGPTGNLYGSDVGTTNPWWGVDLGSSQQIDFLYLYMRQPSASGQYVYDWPFGKSAGARIYASNSNSTPSVPCPSTAPFGGVNMTSCPYTSTGSGCPPGTTLNAQGGCMINANIGAEIAVGGPNVYPTPGLTARYLWLNLPGLYRILALCEFQVYQKKRWVWRSLSGTYNSALGGRASQSSTLSGWGDGQAYRAVDGLVTNKMDNAQPYTVAHTREGGDAPFTWWQVDMGAQVDVQTFRVYARTDCCTGRNVGIRWYVGDSQDFRFNTLCTSAPADITPTTNLNDATQCYTGPEVVTTLGSQPTACYKQWPCKARGRFVQAIKNAGDVNPLAIGEVQVTSNRLLDMPSVRSGMSVSVFGGNIVIFGGADSSGFRNNDVRFFDMLRNMWLPPMTAIGTLPVARANAFFNILPSSTPLAPSNKFILFGGVSNTDQLNDVMEFALPPCAAFDQTITSSVSCYHGGSVCYITCPSFAKSTNGENPVVCQTDGSWRGNFPVCSVDAPSRPINPVAIVNSAGVATVSWNPPLTTGYYTGANAIESYNVKISTNEIYETFSAGKFPDTISPTSGSSTGWDFAGGNWYSLKPKMGRNGQTGQDPVSLLCCSPTNTAVLTEGVANTYDFWQGYLRLGSDYNRNNKFDKNDNQVLFRDWPANLDPAGPWAFETFLSLDTFNIVTAVDHAACIGVVDISDYNGLGVVEFYACLRNGGAQVYQTFQQSSTNAWAQDLYDTAPFNTAYSKPYAAYLRYEHDPANYPFSFRAYWKLNSAEIWMPFPTPPNQLQMRGGPILPGNIRPAIMMRNANTQIRGVALFSYFRIGPIACSDAGSERYVSAASASALIYGLTQGSSYTFTIAARTQAGWGTRSLPTNAIVVPTKPVAANLPLLSQGRPCAMNSFYDASGRDGCEWALDGLTSTFNHNGCNSNSQGGWLTVDLGSVRSIRQIRVVNRQDCCGWRLDRYQIWVSSNTNFLATGQQCNPAMYNPLISTIPGGAQTFPCYSPGSTSTFMSGQYVTIRRNPLNNDCLHVAEFQVFGVADVPLVSQNKPCQMQSVKGINSCGFALDGRLDTYAQNNDNALAVNPNGWLTVDLGVSTVIDSIRVFARRDQAAQTLNNFRLWFGDEPNFWNTNANLRNQICNQSYLPPTFMDLTGNTSTIRCIPNDGTAHISGANAIGRYVTIQSIAGASFSVTELQVYSSNLVLASFNKPCRMSSTYSPFRCSNAFNNVFNDFAHTNADLDNFITVDLGFSTAVRYLKITNRRDCCQTRLNNFEIYIGDSSNYHVNIKCDPTYIPKTWSAANGWAHSFACALTGRYVTMHILTDFMNVAEIQVYAANACPTRTATGATQLGGSVCAGAGYGAVCTHVCNSGWVAVSGSTSSTCNGDVWDQPALVCQPPCADLLPPAYAESCSQTYFTESFNINGGIDRFISLDPYTQKTAIPIDSPPIAAKWFQLDGLLQSSSLIACNSDLHLVISSRRIYDWSSKFTLSARISTSTRAGLVFKAIDKSNLMRFFFDAQLGYAAVQRVVGGSPFVVSEAWSYLFTPDTFHSVSITVQNTQINVTFDGNLIMSTADNTYLVGFAGVYALASALFDDVTFAVGCTYCSGMTDGSSCTFSCSEGLIAVGPLSRACVGTTSITAMAFSPPLAASPLVCTLPAPTFLPSTLFIMENSLKNANVGDPLVAYSSSPDFQVQYQITNVFANGFFQNSNFTPSEIIGQSLFWVDVCSGQVKLRTGGKDIMDYESVNNYILTVRAFVNGFVGAEAIRNVSVVVLNSDEPPVAIPTTVLLDENAALTADGQEIVWRNMENFLTGVMQQYDPENSTVVYSLVVDGGAGELELNTTTGEVRIPSSVIVNGSIVSTSVGFNYESPPTTFQLSVKATQVNDTSMFSVASYTVLVQDVNDPPQLTRNQVLSLSEYTDSAQPASVTYPVLAGFVSSKDEDTNTSWANGTIYTVLSTSAAATACGQTGSWATADGAPLTPPLFAIDPATGGVTLVAMPAIAWRFLTPLVIAGQLVRASYSICVKAEDVAGLFDVQSVTMNIIADLPSLPYISSVSGLTPNPPTIGGTVITFTGANFLPGGTTYPVKASYTNAEGYVYNVAGGCTIVSNTSITCITPPGFGVGFTWTLILDTSVIASLVPLTMSYAAPLVTSLDPFAQSIPTPGGLTLNFYGSNFGPNPSQNPRSGGYIYNYSFPRVYYGNNGNEFECPVSFWNDGQVSCLIPAGVGKDLSWSIFVGSTNQYSPPVGSTSSSLLSYLPPTIDSVVGAGIVRADGLNTLGGESVVITGSNFGPASLTPRTTGIRNDTFTSTEYGQFFVKYGGSDGILLTFTNCRQAPATAHTTITCITVPGVGINHRVQMKIADQISNVWPNTTTTTTNTTDNSCVDGLCYLPPILTSIAGPGAINGDTAGGQYVIISGSHFGPASYPISSIDVDGIAYGHVETDSTHYKAQQCRVLSDSQISCVTAPGVGRNLTWSVSIGSQPASNAGGVPLISSYSNPQVFTFSGPGSMDADTSGNEAVIVTGRNFGPADAYTNALLSVNYGVLLQDGGAAFLSAVPLVRYIAASCTISIAHTQLTCYTVEGAGQSMDWKVVIDSQASSNPTTSYHPPRIDSISYMDGSPVTAASVNGGDVLRLNGDFFGPVTYGTSGRSLLQKVTYGAAGFEFVATTWVVLSEQEIRVVLPPGIGKNLHFIVEVADQFSPSSTGTFDYATPHITLVTPSTANTYSKPTAQTVITVKTLNLPLMDPTTMYRLTLGQGAYAVTRDISLPTMSLASIAAKTNPDDYTVNGTFTLPTDGAGWGLGVSIVISQGTASAVAAVTDAVVDSSIFSYSPPVINSVVVTRALFYDPSSNTSNTNPGGDYVQCPPWSSPWSCTDSSVYQLTLIGNNFGADPALMDHADGVDRKLELLVMNYTAIGIPILGELWARSAPGAPTDTNNAIYLSKWSHTQIVAFVRSTTGTLRLTLTTTSTWLQPAGANVPQSQIYDFANLNPTVSNLVGSLTGVPTSGGVTPITMTIEGLAGATDLKIFVGGDHTTGTEAVIVCPTGGATPDVGQPCADVRASIIVPAASGQTTVVFFVPAGQGVNQPVVAVTYVGAGAGTPKPSNAGFTVSYEPPKITAFSIQLPGQASFPPDTIVSPITDPTIFVPTDGTGRVRVTGTNLGTAPVVSMGDSMVVPASAITSCDPVGVPSLVHTCIEFSPIAGEGDGSLFPEYNYPARVAPPFGYTLFVSAPLGAPYGQDSNAVKFSYLPANVTKVTSITGTFPTEGGVTMLLEGANFGVSNPLRLLPDADSPLGVTVRFVNLNGAGDLLPCKNLVRISHTMLNCTLPEGGGNSLGVAISIAGVDGVMSGSSLFGYDRPVISHSYILNANTTVVDPLDLGGSVNASFAMDGKVVAFSGSGNRIGASSLSGTAAGGDYVVLEGINFGKADAANCAFMAWINRNPAKMLRCNEAEDFLGEGEVSISQVVYWSHTLVVFSSNIGIGFKEIALSVRGTNLASGKTIPFVYNNPVIRSLSEPRGPTEGRDASNNDFKIKIFGDNFGITPRDTSRPVNQLGDNDFPVPLSVAPTLPTAYVVVIFHSSCISSAYTLTGSAVTSIHVSTANTQLPLNPNRNDPDFEKTGYCDSGISFSVDGVTFKLPQGVGANKTVSMVIVDAKDETKNLTSNTASFSYYRPFITSFNPFPAIASWSLTEGGGVAANVISVKVYGNDFGNQENADKQKWSVPERALDMKIAGYSCLNKDNLPAGLVGTVENLQRKRDFPAISSEAQTSSAATSVVYCSVDFRNIPVGIVNVSISIAGQSNTRPEWYPVEGSIAEIDNNPPSGSFMMVCGPGAYGRVNETCRPCPAQYVGTGLLPGATCPGYREGELVFNDRFPYPRPSKGWYNLNKTDRNTLRWGNPDGTQMAACPPGFQDGDRDVCIVPCDPPEACLDDNICSYGYASKPPMFKCTSCDTGFYHQGYSCVKCPDSPWALVVGFTLLVIFAGCVGYLLNQKGVNIAVIGIGIDFFQVLAIFATSGVKWPPVVKELLHILSAFNLNIEIVAPECIVPDLSYKAKFWFIMLLPLSVGGLLLGGVWTTLWFYKTVFMGQPKSTRYSHTPALVSSVLALLYILYLYLTRTIFDVFTCTPTYPPDGRLYMNVANKEQCGIPGGTQLTLMPYAIIGLIVYSFGYPAFVGFVLFKNHENAMLDQLLRAKGVGEDKLTNPHAFKLRQMFGRAYFQFKPDNIYWMLAIVLRKFFIAITAVVFSKNSSFQMAACLLVMFLSYSAQVMVRPYMGPAEYDEVLRLHTEASMTNSIHARLRSLIASIETRGRKKVRKNLLNFEGKVDSTAVLGLLTGWFFNYNTVEQIMVFCAVIVCLMGIMYQSNQANTFYPGALDGVTAVVMITIIFAIIYYFTVVVTEMVILYNEDASRKRAVMAGGRERSGSKKIDAAASIGSNGGKLVGTDGEIQTGKLDTQMNPLFMNNSGNVDASNAAMGMDSVMAQRTPPPPEVWVLIQRNYSDMVKQLELANKVAAEVKKKQQLDEDANEDVSSSPNGSSLNTDGHSSANPMPRLGAGKKKGFSPTSTTGGSSNSMSTFRSNNSMQSLKSSRKMASASSAE